ncbi:hypothetical protein [Streptomyces sp. NPDC059575]|uniref:hypothetical protein n=1 Tax=Streptomyces sp. NPDC059575 TaxID=3346872 RepID=UPI0036872A00
MRPQQVHGPDLDRHVGSRGPHRFLPAGQDVLTKLRRTFYEEVIALLGDSRPVRVATYVLNVPGTDSGHWHSTLTDHAGEQGWAVYREPFTDETDPDRPEFDAACRLAGAGFIDGILAVRRSNLPPDDVYEERLRWLRGRRAFVAFYQPTTIGAR